jgi:hypothetical protein
LRAARPDVDRDDTGLLRHLGLLLRLVKACALLAGLFLFPLIVIDKICAVFQARGTLARGHALVLALAWASAADVYCLMVLSMLANLSAVVAPSGALPWLYVSALFDDASGIDMVINETALMTACAVALSILACCLGAWQARMD